MNENWIIYKKSPKSTGKSVFIRYGVATLLPCLAAYLTGMRPSLAETPHFMFLGAIILSALYGGVGPAFFTTSLCTILVQVLFVHPFSALGLSGFMDRMECMGLFLLVSLMIACLVAALRKERNALQESEERYRVLAETASDAILVIDERGQILFGNGVAERMFGVQTATLPGQNIARLLPQWIYEPYIVANDAKEPQSTVAFQLEPAHNKKMLLEMTLSAFSKQGRRLYTAIIRDITRLRRAEPVTVAA